MARRAQGIQRHREQGGDRKARGHCEGTGRRRSASQQSRAIINLKPAAASAAGGLLEARIQSLMAAISLRKLNKHYGSVFHAVKEVDLEIARKEFVGRVCPSGWGNTTTLSVIAGLGRTTTG